MLVRERMTSSPIIIPPEMSAPDALRIMRDRKVRRLPVLDKHERLVGIVTDKDLLRAAPSPSTTLARWEIAPLFDKIKVEEVMTRDVITVSEDTPLEEAASLLADRKIGGMPVMQEKRVVGVITQTDLFKSFLELLGGRRPGVRMTVTVTGGKGVLAKITNAISGVGGDIVGLGFREVPNQMGHDWQITFKVQEVSADQLVTAVRPLVTKVVDVRQL
jgi:acetoin utilization protein AcuB